MAKPKWAHPQAIEDEYRAELRRYAKRCQRASNELIIPEIKGLVEMAGLRSDAIGESWPDRLASLLQGVLDSIKGIGGTLGIYFGMSGPARPEDVGVDGYGSRVERFNMRQMQRQVERQYGERYNRREPWMNGLMRAWELENLSLIRSIPEQYVERLQGVITRAISEGMSVTAVQEQIRAQYKHAMNRANLIARDQIGKLNARITQYRQEAVGIKGYIWRGVMDDRERRLHREREGRSFLWSKPPSDGHPANPVNCRCWAEPDWPSRDEVRLNDG